jgi:hypothetical protein
MVTTLVRYECRKCRNPITNEVCPCSIEQVWQETGETHAPKYVLKQWCLVPAGIGAHQHRAQWKTTRYIRKEE